MLTQGRVVLLLFHFCVSGVIILWNHRIMEVGKSFQDHRVQLVDILHLLTQPRALSASSSCVMRDRNVSLCFSVAKQCEGSSPLEVLSM